MGEPPDEWDYGWDATYDDASEAYDYKEEISEPKVRKVKVAKQTTDAPKRRKAKRRSKKSAKKKEDKIDEEEVMSSALDKLIYNHEPETPTLRVHLLRILPNQVKRTERPATSSA